MFSRKAMTIKLTPIKMSKQLLILGVALLTVFCAFFSLIHISFGMEALVLGLVLLAFCNNRSELLCTIPALLVLFVTLSLLLLSGRVMERGFNAPIGHAMKSIYFFYAIILSVIIRKLTPNQIKATIHLTMVLLVLSCIISVYYVFRGDAYAIRYNVSIGYTKVLRFEQTYSLMLAIPVFLYSWLASKTNNRRTNIGLLVFISIAAITIVFSRLTTALLLTAFGVFIVLMIHIYQKHKKVFALLLIGILFVMLLAFFFSDQIAKLLFNMTSGMDEIIRLRIRSIIDKVFSTNYNVGYTTRRREELASYSFSSFKNNWLLGVGYKGYGYGMIGGHQEWVDLLGTFGVIGFLCFAIMMAFYSWLTLKWCRTDVDRKCFIIGLILFVSLGLLDPCLQMQGLIMLFCIAPHLSVLFEKQEVRNG